MQVDYLGNPSKYITKQLKIRHTMNQVWPVRILVIPEMAMLLGLKQFHCLGHLSRLQIRWKARAHLRPRLRHATRLMIGWENFIKIFLLDSIRGIHDVFRMPIIIETERNCPVMILEDTLFRNLADLFKRIRMKSGENFAIFMLIQGRRRYNCGSFCSNF